TRDADLGHLAADSANPEAHRYTSFTPDFGATKIPPESPAHVLALHWVHERPLGAGAVHCSRRQAAAVCWLGTVDKVI
ncbi:MAG: hypothetical protein Q8S19_09600, partial [Bacillota bacterium]|nr:hypothetical protein [Bacillota bacterium]